MEERKDLPRGEGLMAFLGGTLADVTVLVAAAFSPHNTNGQQREGAYFRERWVIEVHVFMEFHDVSTRNTVSIDVVSPQESFEEALLQKLENALEEDVGILIRKRGS
jgi:hypothetical protein